MKISVEIENDGTFSVITDADQDKGWVVVDVENDGGRYWTCTDLDHIE